MWRKKTKNYFNLLSSREVYTYRVPNVSIWRQGDILTLIKKVFWQRLSSFSSQYLPKLEEEDFFQGDGQKSARGWNFGDEHCLFRKLLDNLEG